MDVKKRPLKPDWMLKPGPWKTLKEKGTNAYLLELKEIQKKAEIVYEKKRKERMDYLFKIYHEQSYRDMMWPYDLAKRMGSDDITLQYCRDVDHEYDYEREFSAEEYNPDNYIPEDNYEYPEYDNLYNFENDNGEDLND